MVIILSLPGDSESTCCGEKDDASVPHCDLGGPVPGAQVDLGMPSAAPNPDLATQDLPDWIGGGHMTHAGRQSTQSRQRDHSKRAVCLDVCWGLVAIPNKFVHEFLDPSQHISPPFT